MTTSSPMKSRQIEVEDSFQKSFELFYEKGWTDGLPICPPTETAVEEMLRFTDRKPQDVVCVMPPRNGTATVEKIAINAVMAGCRPEYLPVLITACEAIVEAKYNLYGRQTTTHPGAHLLIINGPLREELDVNCRYNVFGHGWRANATMGRALRLILINIGGSQPGITDMATHGHPGNYSYCMGEDQEGSPWPPFHVDRGLSPQTSAVTVICAEAPHNINDLTSKTPYRFLGSAASTMGTLGGNALYTSGQRTEHMLVITSESAQWLAQFGWSKSDVRMFIFDKARKPIRELRNRGKWGQHAPPRFVDPDDDDAMVPIVGHPDDILVLVAGGPGRHMNAILTAGYSLSVTRAITLKDGTPARSIHDFCK